MSDSDQDLSGFVQRLVEAVVDVPDEVEVAQERDRRGYVYMVTVGPDDVGRVIGKQGRVISCIRQVVGAAGEKIRQKAYVKVDAD